MKKHKIRTFTVKATPEQQEALEALAAVREKFLRMQDVPPLNISASAEYYDELCKKEGINMSGEEFKKLVEAAHAANEEAKHELE